MKDLYQGFFAENPDFKVCKVPAKDKFDNNLETLLEVMNAVQVTNQMKSFDCGIDNKYIKFFCHILLLYLVIRG